jgi:SAM-dependent methyltransferase
MQPRSDTTAIDPDAFDAFEAAGWQRRADGYDRFFAPITGRLADPLLDAASVTAGTRLLDVATGPGYVAGRAGERGASVTGIDMAESMLALARRLHPALDFRRADVNALPFADASFDAVVGNFLILHLGRPEQAVAELVRVLAPGGTLALTTWDVPERARLFGVFLDAIADAGAAPPADIPPGPDFFRFSDEAEFAGLLGEQGLERCEVRTVSFTHRVATADELWHGLLRGTVRTGALILEQREDVRRRIREAFDRRASRYRAGGGLELPVSVKLASGRRAPG